VFANFAYLDALLQKKANNSVLLVSTALTQILSETANVFSAPLVGLMQMTVVPRVISVPRARMRQYQDLHHAFHASLEPFLTGRGQVRVHHVQLANFKA